MDNAQLRVYQGATAVITGGASGIGRALGEELARRGAEVFLADLQGELAEEVAAGIRREGGKASACMLDVSDYAALDALMHEAYERTGRLDFMFNNAGMDVGGPPERHSIEDWRRVIDVNLFGVINGVHVAYPIMLRQGFGHIINTASMAAFFPMPIAITYSTTKHAIFGLSVSLRVAAARNGIRVSVLCPGVVRTPILAGGKFGKDLFGGTSQQHLDFFEKYKPMPVGDFARETLKAVARNQDIIIIPSWWKRFWWLQRLSPSLVIKNAEKEYEEVLSSWSEKFEAP